MFVWKGLNAGLKFPTWRGLTDNGACFSTSGSLPFGLNTWRAAANGFVTGSMTGASGFENEGTAKGLSSCFVVANGTSVISFGCASKNGLVPNDGTFVKTVDVDSFGDVTGTVEKIFLSLAATTFA